MSAADVVRASDLALEQLKQAFAEFTQVADEPSTSASLVIEDAVDSGIVRRAGAAGGEVWSADLGAEAAEFEAAFARARKGGGLAPWAEANAVSCEKWRAVHERLASRCDAVGDFAGRDEARVAAAEYRLERETWALVSSLHEANLFFTDEDHEVKQSDDPTPDERVEAEAKTSVASRRRRCALEWLERGAVEFVRYFAGPSVSSSALDGDAAEGIVALLTLADDASLEALSVSVWTRADELVALSEGELEACRATWQLVRAGRHDEAASVDERRGAYWRAAALRARRPQGYDKDALRTGNPALGLWRSCCARRADASRTVALTTQDRKPRVEDAFRRASSAADVENRVGRAVDLNGRAAAYDAALFSALAGDLEALRQLPAVVDGWEDEAWAALACLDVAARFAAARQPNDDGLVLELPAVFESVKPDSKLDAPFRSAAASMACFGVDAVPSLLDPAKRGGLAIGAESAPRRFDRLCAHLGQAWKWARPDADPALVDDWLRKHTQSLQATPWLCASYAASLSDPEQQVEACAQGFSHALETTDRKKCVEAALAAFGDDSEAPPRIVKQAASLTVDGLWDDPRLLKALEWLLPPRLAPDLDHFSPSPDAVDLIELSNTMLRRWLKSDVDADTKWARAPLVNFVDRANALNDAARAKEALDDVFDVARAASPRVRPAARALKEYLCWRSLVHALERLDSWNDARAAATDTNKRQRTDPLKDQRPVPIDALATTAEAARLALELALCFPGLGRLRKLEWGPGLPIEEPHELDDPDELAWRLDAFCGHSRLADQWPPALGWLILDDDDDNNDNGELGDLRRLVLPRLVFALADLCKDTADALADLDEDSLAKTWYAHCLAIPSLVVNGRRLKDDLAVVLDPDLKAALLSRVAHAALELLRFVPPECTLQGTRDVNWSKLLEDPTAIFN